MCARAARGRTRRNIADAVATRCTKVRKVEKWNPIPQATSAAEKRHLFTMMRATEEHMFHNATTTADDESAMLLSPLSGACGGMYV